MNKVPRDIGPCPMPPVPSSEITQWWEAQASHRYVGVVVAYLPKTDPMKLGISADCRESQSVRLWCQRYLFQGHRSRAQFPSNFFVGNATAEGSDITTKRPHKSFIGQAHLNRQPLLSEQANCWVRETRSYSSFLNLLFPTAMKDTLESAVAD